MHPTDCGGTLRQLRSLGGDEHRCGFDGPGADLNAASGTKRDENARMADIRNRMARDRVHARGFASLSKEPGET